MTPETVTIPATEYATMLDQLAWLNALEAAGVDNWSGYDTARDMYTEGQEAI